MDLRYREKFKFPEFKEPTKEKYTKIECPSCNNQVPGTALNINDKIGKCDDCNIVFSFERIVNSSLTPQNIKQELIKPEGVDFFYFKDELELTIDQPPAMLNIILASLLPAVSIIFFLLYMVDGLTAFLTPAILTGLLCSYSIYKLIRHKQDKIYVNIDQENIHIHFRPKNFIRDKKIPIEKVRQLYIKSKSNGKSLYLITDTPDGQKHEQLIGRFSSIAKAKFVEQEIEKFLNIDDQSVPGEAS